MSWGSIKADYTWAGLCHLESDSAPDVKTGRQALASLPFHHSTPQTLSHLVDRVYFNCPGTLIPQSRVHHLVVGSKIISFAMQEVRGEINGDRYGER